MVIDADTFSPDPAGISINDECDVHPAALVDTYVKSATHSRLAPRPEVTPDQVLRRRRPVGDGRPPDRTRRRRAGQTLISRPRAAGRVDAHRAGAAHFLAPYTGSYRRIAAMTSGSGHWRDVMGSLTGRLGGARLIAWGRGAAATVTPYSRGVCLPPSHARVLVRSGGRFWPRGQVARSALPCVQRRPVTPRERRR